MKKKMDYTNRFMMATGGEDGNGNLLANCIVYVCRHDESGAFGIIINKPSKTPVSELLDSLEIDANDGERGMIMQGGPVKQEQVFILHTPPDEYDVTIKVGKDVGVTLSRDILIAISENRAPQKLLFACGYVGWDAGQLEDEIMENEWLVLPASVDIIFDLPPAERMTEATRRFGFELANFWDETGHA